MRRIASYTPLPTAFKRLVALTQPGPSPELVPVDNCYGRILAEDIEAPISKPEFDMSHMDGFALRAADTAAASRTRPIQLKVSGFSRPGERLSSPLPPESAVRILTGGFLPEGADAVLPQEDAAWAGEDKVTVLKKVDKGENVIPEGFDIKRGEQLYRRGMTMRAQDIGVLLNLRITAVNVYRKPIVAIASIGSELVEDRAELAPGKILTTHGRVVQRMIEAAGGVPVNLGVVPDEVETIASKISDGLKAADIVVTIGGSSVSEIDLVEEACRRISKKAEILHGIKLQPGRVSGYAVIEGKPVIFLPGLIQSTVNSFIFLAYPLMNLMLGLPASMSQISLEAKLQRGITFRSFKNFKKVVWAKLKHGKSGYRATPLQGDSSMHSIIASADGYFVADERSARLRRNTRVRVHLFPGLWSGERLW